jgi:hypothetical protein
MPERDLARGQARRMTTSQRLGIWASPAHAPVHVAQLAVGAVERGKGLAQQLHDVLRVRERLVLQQPAAACMLSAAGSCEQAVSSWHPCTCCQQRAAHVHAVSLQSSSMSPSMSLSSVPGPMRLPAAPRWLPPSMYGACTQICLLASAQAEAPRGRICSSSRTLHALPTCNRREHPCRMCRGAVLCRTASPGACR